MCCVSEGGSETATGSKFNGHITYYDYPQRTHYVGIKVPSLAEFKNAGYYL